MFISSTMKINRNYEECVFELFPPRNKICRCKIQYSYTLKYNMFDINSQSFKYKYPSTGACKNPHCL